MTLRTTHHAAPDGVPLAVHELGEGVPLLLLHGLFSDARTNWLRYRHAAHLVTAGYRVIMPDLRAHGTSGKPHDPVHYPPDILADDALFLVRQLGLTDYDLGGYSLGGRTVARMLARGARPRRAVIAGMGLSGLTGTGDRVAFFRRVLANPGGHASGSPEWMAAAFLKSTGGDAAALIHILDTFVDTPESVIAGLDLPVGVISGRDDADNGSAAALADTLPGGTLITIPGNHMSAVTRPDLGHAIADFLTA